MSKSLGDGHCIYIDEDPKDIEKKLSRAVTDTGDGASQGAKNLLDLAKIFCKKDTHNAFIAEKKVGNLKYSELKTTLAHGIGEYFSEFRNKKRALMEHPEKLEKILEDGAKNAKSVAETTLEEVKKRVGLMK